MWPLKMKFNVDKGIYENTSLIKQGFVNYQYITLDDWKTRLSLH